jgi:hypothetical protein
MSLAAVRTPERRLLLFAFLARIVPAWLIFGADDVTAWQVWGRAMLQGGNPYATKFPVTWPPLWLPFTAFAVQISETTGVPFQVAVKMPAICADIIITFLLYAVAERYGRRAYPTALAYALNPLSIYTTAIHGQFDSLPLLCMTMALLFYDRDDVRAGTWLGIGAAFKTWPLLVLPALLARRRRVVVIALTPILMWIGALLIPWPFIGFSAVSIAFGYRGMAGWWGLTSLTQLLSIPLSETVVRWIFYAAMAFASLVVLKLRPPVATAALFLLLTVYVTSPGVAPHYLIWILPVALIADPRRTAAYTIIGSVMLAIEISLRPYAGHFGDTLRVLPYSGYARALGDPVDWMATVLDRLAVWAFCCLWWVVTLRAMRSASFVPIHSVTADRY